MKPWMMKYATEGHPFLITVYNRLNCSEICIGIVHNVIVKSQLLRVIDLNELDLDYILGNVEVKFMWCKNFTQQRQDEKWATVFYHAAIMEVMKIMFIMNVK